MSCHDDGTTPRTTDADGSAGQSQVGSALAKMPRIILVGNPNVGKSTLFNRLTGARQRTMNAPGTTVQLETGRWHLASARAAGASIGAAPGDAIREVPAGQPHDPIRHDYVELVDLPGSYSLLAASPDEVVTAEAVVGTGVLETRADLAVIVADATALSRSMYLLAQVADFAVPAILALTMTDVAKVRGVGIASQRLSEILGIPVVAVDPRTGKGKSDLAAAIDDALITAPRPLGITPAFVDVDASVALARIGERAEDHFDWVAAIDAKLDIPTDLRRTWSDRIDSALLNPWIGLPVFLAVMWLVFQLTTSVAAPMQDAIEQGGGWAGDRLTDLLALVSWESGWFQGFLVDGLLAGVTTVLTFIPPMGIMFIALSLLEDSGYMARAAFVADRAMRVVGLDGRAFLPLVIGFGCNLPALAATRTLPNARHRLLTGLLVPFSSCTARLVVYILLATVFFPDHAGTVIFLMYVVSVVLIIGVGLLLRATVMRDVRPEPFVLNLPAYQAPRPKPMAASVLLRLRSFVVRAGRVIIAALVIMWALMAVPVSGGSFGQTNIEDSLYGHTAEAIAPVFAPAGFGDWHASAALVTGFFAKEVVVGALAQSYAVSEPEDPESPGDLGSQLRATFERTSNGNPEAAALAFMVFVLAYTPCAAAVAEQRRLFGWKPALGAVAFSLVLAWVLSVGVFQIGSLL